MFKDTSEGQTNYCSHKTDNTSGICDACLGKEHFDNCPNCQEPNFIFQELAQQKEEIKSKIPKIYCPLNKLADDGVHIVYKCLDCGQVWGEEEKTPLCLNAKIRLADLLKLYN